MKVNRSEIIAIEGKSGAGKTTLLKIIGKLEDPDSGIIYFNNQNITLLNNKGKFLEVILSVLFSVSLSST